MAIAFDTHAAASGNLNGVSYTMGLGSHGVLLVATNWAGTSATPISAISYGGTNMTFVGGHGCNSGSPSDVWLYYLNNPPTGANTFSVTQTGNAAGYTILSYTGSSIPASFNSTVVIDCGGTSNTNTVSLTVSANSWMALFVTEAGSTATAGANTTLRDSINGVTNFSGDSNGALSAGSHSLTAAWSAAASNTGIAIEIPLPSGVIPLRSLLGVGI